MSSRRAAAAGRPRVCPRRDRPDRGAAVRGLGRARSTWWTVTTTAWWPSTARSPCPSGLAAPTKFERTRRSGSAVLEAGRFTCGTCVSPSALAFAGSLSWACSTVAGPHDSSSCRSCAMAWSSAASSSAARGSGRSPASRSHCSRASPTRPPSPSRTPACRRISRRRNRELTEALEQQTATAEILRVICRLADGPPAGARRHLAERRRVCGADDATVLLLEDGIVRVAAHYGPIARSVPESRALAADLRLADGASSTAAGAHSRHPGPDGDEFAQYRATAEQTGYRTLVAVPMLREEEAIGVAQHPQPSRCGPSRTSRSRWWRPSPTRRSSPSRTSASSRSCSAQPRADRGAGAADGHQRDPEGHRDSPTDTCAGARRHRPQRGAALRRALGRSSSASTARSRRRRHHNVSPDELRIQRSTRAYGPRSRPGRASSIGARCRSFDVQDVRLGRATCRRVRASVRPRASEQLRARVPMRREGELIGVIA